jgi:hypothetical protein
VTVARHMTPHSRPTLSVAAWRIRTTRGATTHFRWPRFPSQPGEMNLESLTSVIVARLRSSRFHASR